MKAWSAHEPDTALSCCRTLHVKHAAYASALYTLNISILVVLLYSWRIGVNAKRFKELDDVYYGVQIAYFAIIGTQMFMIVLSIFLFYGIYKENVAFLVPWVVGCMTCMALEAMAMVYSNILRDHVNKEFDAMCKAEISFLIPRIIMNCLCIYCVLRLYHLLRAGVTWKGSAAIEL
ncbi:uncharacterized protein LOC121728943 [Aricia agestis]|uniref:uncharacterized protein LOC121728943 n=1 Tax=Aricia agestis TaxID=91739 RepID=UPI001C20915E|nr:uncharacterized protein LOC121728943 [Aricia agestis]